jgi:disease resistance protein RPM1
VDPRLNALYKNSSELVGMQEPRDALVEMIMPALGNKEDRPTEMMKIVSIVGSAGLGKTTVAKAAYDKISRNFDCCAFVPVGQNPVPKKVLKDILNGLIRHETKKNERNRDQMQKDGNDHGKKRYTVADLV